MTANSPGIALDSFLTRDPSTLELLARLEKTASCDVPVLVEGESGTGKELLARLIHRLSSRAGGPLVSLNCGALQDNLLASELFGHERGAFTGATSQKMGLVEAATGGTLFLDEIGDIGWEAQAKLLRFLEHGEVYRLGSKQPLRVDVRVISATNKDLASEVRKGRFREDLYYRINTVTLRVAPLRDRPGDIPLLLSHYTGGSANGPARIRFTEGAVERLLRHPWPGNVRELRNLVERLQVLSEEPLIDETALMQALGQNDLAEPQESPFLLDQIEKRHIYRVLAHFEGNKTRAARALGITVKTLYNKLSRYSRESRTAQGPTPLSKT